MKILKRKINLSGFRQALMIFCFPAFISTACAVTYVRDDIPNITQSQSQLKTPKTFQVTQNCDGKYCLSGIDKTQEQSKSALKIEMSHEQCREDMGVTGFLSILTIGIVPGVLNYDCQISVRLQSSFEKRIETYKYQRTQNTIIGWLMLPGFLITPLFDRLQYNLWDDVNHSNEFRDFVKSDLGSKLSKSKYYQNTIKSHISYLKVEKDRERAEYKKLISRPRTVKQYLEFYDKSNHKEVYDKAWDKIHKRLDAHLVQLVRQKYRLNANDPVYEDGKEVGSLRHLFRLILLSNSDGLIDIEVKPVRQCSFQASAGSTCLLFTQSRGDVALFIKRIRGKWVINGLEANGNYNPRNWQYISTMLWNKISKYPANDKFSKQALKLVIRE